MAPSSPWRRLANASLAFVQTYKDEYLSPAERPEVAETNAYEQWDTYQSRLFRYLHYNYYYSNKAYTALVKYAQQHRATRGLYKYVRGIYNPVFRLVELQTSKAFSGTLDWERMQTGAVPFNRLDNNHRSAIRNLWKWSNMGSVKTRYPRNCARFGDSIMKVVDDPFKEKVRLELLHPGLIADADITPQGYFDRVLIAYWRQDDDPLSPPWLYEEEITKDSFRTYRDGEPWGEYLDANGTVITGWPNEYGFVPVVLTRAIELDKNWGAAPFFPTLDKIDQVNDIASVTYDQIRKAVNPLWWLEGVSSMTQVQAAVTTEEGHDRDKVGVLLGPLGSKPTAMVADLNISDALAAIEAILKEIENDHPELSLHRLRTGERVTGPGTLTAYDDAIQRIRDFRSVIDSGMLRATQMAISIGGYRGYDGFDGFDLDSYDRGDLDFEIADRPVLADNLTKKERVDSLIASGAPKRRIWTELDMTEAEIDEGLQELEDRRADQAAQWSTNNPNDTSSSPEPETNSEGETA